MNVNEIASLGSNVKTMIQNENCSVLMLNDATGEGVMTIYRVMPGVMICFSDMHMERCASEFELKNDKKVFCMKKCFKDVYGDSIYSYQKRYRINLAANMLLQDKTKEIQEIAASLGYENPGKFSAAFRSVMGVSPAEYRYVIKGLDGSHG